MVTTGKNAIKHTKGLVPEEVFEVLEAAWTQPFTVSSDYARNRAFWVAYAASLNFITTIGLDGRSVGRTWHTTAMGASALQHKEYLCGN